MSNYRGDYNLRSSSFKQFQGIQKALEKSRKVSHQVSRDFKKYIEAADYWKRFTTHTNKTGLGKGT